MKRKRKQQVQGVHDGERKKTATKNNKDIKNNLRGNSKGSKKLQNRRTILMSSVKISHLS